MIPVRSLGTLLLGVIVITGCASPAGGPSSSGGAPGQVQPGKTLVVAGRAERPSLGSRPFRSLGLTGDMAGRMFNAELTIKNDAGAPVPYLAENVPQLDTDTWRVFPDGRMETRYRLKPSLVWHDGQPLTAEDFVFAYQVFWNPEFALNASAPGSLIDRVTAPDPRTIVLHWKSTYPEADTMSSGNNTVLPPLPRHILSQIYAASDPEAFIAHSFWTQGYVDAGPYKLERWEPGAFLEGVAFDQHVLGKPKIPRIRQLFISDPNTVLANLLAGEVALTTGDSIRFTDGETLRQQWADKGQVLNFPNLYRITQFQRKPEYASTLAFTDLRVRQALHHGLDIATLNEAIQGGRTSAAHGPITPTKTYYPELERVVAKYPFEPRRSEQLMLEAGFARGPDGVWVHPSPRFGRMSFEDNVLANPDSNAELAIKADTWRKLGFDVKEVTWAPVIGSDTTARNTFPGLSTTSTGYGEDAFASYHSGRIPTAENRWRGSNRGAWQGSPEFDRLVELWETSLDRSARTQAIVQMARIMTEDVVVINLYWKLNAVGAANGVVGPRLTDPDGSPDWNLHEWEYR